MDPSPKLSVLLGMEEGGIRVFISMIGTVVFAYPQKLISQRLSPRLHHVFNILTGIAFMYYCFGSGVLHNLCDIIVISFLLRLAGGTLISVIITWFVVFGHLLWGYYLELLAGEKLPLNWTTAQCVLTLKLIGLATSLYDAKRGNAVDVRSKLDEEYVLDSTKVEVIEIVGFCCQFSTCIIGPQISFRRYREFVTGTLYSREATSGNMSYAWKKIGLSLLYTMYYLSLVYCLPSFEYFHTDAFAREPFVKKFFLSGILFFVSFRRYMIVWLLAESSCALLGLGYKRNKDGSYDWTGCDCVNVWNFETTATLQGFFSSMNISVNNWIIYYLHRRLKFLKSPALSQMFILIFSALWHSLFPGVFVAFIGSLPQIMFERSFHNFIRIYFGASKQWPLPVVIIGTILSNIYLNIFLGFLSFSFTYSDPAAYLKFWKDVDYFGFYLVAIEFLLSFAINMITQRLKAQEAKKSK